MILLHLTMNQVFNFLKISSSITCTWPNNFDAGKNGKFVLREITWILAVLTVSVEEVALLCAIYQYSDDITTIMKALSQFIALIEVTFNLALCKWKSARIQHLLEEIKDFLHASNDREKIILQKYIDRYSNFAVFVVICYVTTIIVFSCGPLFLSRKFPTEGWYPFPTESWSVITVIYIIQIYNIVQCGLVVSTDFIISVFIFYASARLEILCLKIQDAGNKLQMNSYIQEHQTIIEFVSKTRNIAKCYLFKTNITMVLVAICCGFPIIRRQSLWVTCQFVCFLLAAAERLYITAWPADDLQENSKWIAMAVYNMSWVGKPRSIRRNMCFIMQRAQKPLVINMGDLLPNLSLEYYSKYIITMFSYFTTMTAIISD